MSEWHRTKSLSKGEMIHNDGLKQKDPKGPRIRCIPHGSLGLSSINVNLAAKGPGGWQKSLQRQK